MPNPRNRWLAIMLMSFVLAPMLQGADKELDVKDYCDLAVKALMVAESEARDRISVLQTHEGNAKALTGKMQTLHAEYNRQRNELYATYGTSIQEFLRYGARHQAAIKQYLEENPGVQASLENANSQVESLRQQMDALEADKLQKANRK